MPRFEAHEAAFYSPLNAILRADQYNKSYDLEVAQHRQQAEDNRDARILANAKWEWDKERARVNDERNNRLDAVSAAHYAMADKLAQARIDDMLADNQYQRDVLAARRAAAGAGGNAPSIADEYALWRRINELGGQATRPAPSPAPSRQTNTPIIDNAAVETILEAGRKKPTGLPGFSLLDIFGMGRTPAP